MFEIEFIRHGPKQIDLQSKGHETKLTDLGTKAVKEYSQKLVSTLVESQYTKVIIYTSPVERAYDTAKIIYSEIKQNSNIKTQLPIIEPKFSSYTVNGGLIQNLSPKEMSKIWGEAKDNTQDN